MSSTAPPNTIWVTGCFPFQTPLTQTPTKIRSIVFGHGIALFLTLSRCPTAPEFSLCLHDPGVTSRNNYTRLRLCCFFCQQDDRKHVRPIVTDTRVQAVEMGSNFDLFSNTQQNNKKLRVSGPQKGPFRFVRSKPFRCGPDPSTLPPILKSPSSEPKFLTCQEAYEALLPREAA